jgi:hypothetical protein
MHFQGQAIPCGARAAINAVESIHLCTQLAGAFIALMGLITAMR